MTRIKKSISVILVFILLSQSAFAIISFSEINPCSGYNEICPLDDDFPLVIGG